MRGALISPSLLLQSRFRERSTGGAGGRIGSRHPLARRGVSTIGVGLGHGRFRRARSFGSMARLPLAGGGLRRTCIRWRRGPYRAAPHARAAARTGRAGSRNSDSRRLRGGPSRIFRRPSALRARTRAACACAGDALHAPGECASRAALRAEDRDGRARAQAPQLSEPRRI